MTQAGTKKEQTSTALEKAVEYQAFGSAETVKLSINIVKQWLVTPTATGKMPTDSDVMKFIMLCKARQLNPWEGDAFLVGYDSNRGASFSLITAHQALLKRAEASADYDGMESGVIVESDGVIQELHGDFLLPSMNLLGAWAKVFRKDQSHPKIARLNLETFDKDRAQWKTNKAGMIVKCAEADALRGAFPNTLGGLYNSAEMPHTSGGALVDSMAAKTAERLESLKETAAGHTKDVVLGEFPNPIPEEQMVVPDGVVDAEVIEEAQAEADAAMVKED